MSDRTSVSPAPRAPFRDPLTRRGPGLRPLDLAQWIEIDAAYEPQMALRDSLIGTRPALVAGIASGPLAALGDAAVAEFWSVLTAHLAERQKGVFLRQKGAIRRPDGVTVIETGGIGALGRLVQEDWALLGAGADGVYRLIAGVICFPSRWRFRERLGAPLGALHAPVPHYAETLGPRVDRVFAAMRVETPLERANWTVHRSPELYQPARVADAGGWWLRTERQTLRRLPETRAIVFGIKSAITPVAALDADTRSALIEAVDALSGEEQSYKGLVGAAERMRREFTAG
ncbi:MAG: DUF3445 domain-containing protein [Pseudomonadota bacterium]